MFARVTAACLAILVSVLVGQAEAGILPPDEHNRLVARFEHGSMVFFVARGPANSCGPGCNEWIAAVGRFDEKTPQRFRDLLATLNGRQLPIFFHSPGGLGGPGRELGEMLREHRFTAGIGKTDAKQCRVFDAKDAACQQRIKRAEPVDARLSMRDGQCASSCVFAFAGASQRSIAPGALVGVHAMAIRSFEEQAKKIVADGGPKLTKSASLGLVNIGAKWHFLRMGVDARLVDLFAKVPHERVYVLSRDEIGRFGLETRSDQFETGWVSRDLSNGEFVVVAKSVTRRSASHRPEYLTAQVQIGCDGNTKTAILRYRRELPLDPDQLTTDLRVQLADEEISLPMTSPQPAIETGAIGLNRSGRLAQLSKSPAITISERLKSGERTHSSVAVAGLAPGLDEVSKRCADTRNPIPYAPFAPFLPQH